MRDDTIKPKRGARWGSVLALLVGVATGLLSCADITYYGQALNGHWQVLGKSRPVNAMLADPDTELALRERLGIARELREFASRTLLLPDNGSYRSYADVQRPYVVYNVFAAPPLSLQPQTWCFPLVGCVDYRGYFDAAEARRFGGGLRAANYDVYIAGTPAYSTLGWFSDPLLNTYLHWPTGQLAELIFHELAHQKLYIPNDTTFNESFATAVGQLGTELWLRDRPAERRAYLQSRRYRDEFMDLALAAKNELAKLYASTLTDAAKHAAKGQILTELRARYQLFKQVRWQGYSGYDPWFEQDLNNAKFAALNAYSHYVPAFIALFHSLDNDFKAFYRTVAELGELSYSARQRRLRALLPSTPVDAAQALVAR